MIPDFRLLVDQQQWDASWRPPFAASASRFLSAL
jgi:hypothetical protein